MKKKKKEKKVGRSHAKMEDTRLRIKSEIEARRLSFESETWFVTIGQRRARGEREREKWEKSLRLGELKCSEREGGKGGGGNNNSKNHIGT